MNKKNCKSPNHYVITRIAVNYSVSIIRYFTRELMMLKMNERIVVIK